MDCIDTSPVPGPVVEWTLAAGEEHVGHHAHAPHVGTGGGRLAVHHLGRHELDGALQLGDVHPPGLSQLPRQSEVNYFQAIVRVLEK